jgi:hypothetical protein
MKGLIIQGAMLFIGAIGKQAWYRRAPDCVVVALWKVVGGLRGIGGALGPLG